MGLYFITKRKHDIYDNRIQVVDNINPLIEYLTDKTEICYDKEFSSLNIHKAIPLLTQLGDDQNQFVIDDTSIDLLPFWLQIAPKFNEITFIGHNIEIDYRVHRKQGFPLFRRVFDTMIAEQLIGKGTKNPNDLNSIVQRRLGILPLAKDVRVTFVGMQETSIFSDKHIIYGADDIKHLKVLKSIQEQVIEKRQLQRDIYEIEMPLVTILADICYNGIKLDVNKWKANIQNNKDKAETLVNEMNELLRDLRNSQFPRLQEVYLKKETKSQTVYQLDMFGDSKIVDLKHKRGINFNSTDQVAHIFSLIGLQPPTFKVKNQKTGIKEEKTSIREAALEKYLNTNREWLDKRIILWLEKLVEYKKTLKSIDSFGERYLMEAYKKEGTKPTPGYMNYITGKVHTIYRQCGTETTRMSSGDAATNKKKDKKKPGDLIKDVAYFNSQNIPKSNDYRTCFIAEEGKVFDTCDLSSAELVIAASNSGDKKLIELVTNPEADVHSSLAQPCYNSIAKYILYNMPEKRAKEELALVFKADYRILNISEEEAHRITKERVKTLWDKEYLDINSKETEDIRTHFKNVVYGISYGAAVERLMEVLNVAKTYAEIVASTMQETLPEFFEYQSKIVEEVLKTGYVRFHPDYGGIHIFPQVLEFKKWKKPLPLNLKGDIERACKNYPIQGTQGLMLKKAINDYFYNYVFPNNYDVQLMLVVHDELVIQRNKDENEHAIMLQKTMCESANTFLRHGITMKSKIITKETWYK